MKTTPRIHLDSELEHQREIALPREQAHYLATVLRLAAGDAVSVFNARDGEWLAYLTELTKKGVRWKDPVQRYKGLGEMDADQLAETTMDPRHRTLRRITADDAARASEVFELLMGSDVAPRKEFIVAGAYEVDQDTIDA